MDGPNPKRSGNRNNIGDVWVVAEFTPRRRRRKPLRARAHLLVTVPVYMRWVNVGGGQMSVLAAREHHRFEAAGRPFVYLVPSAAIFALDETADAVLRALDRTAPRTRERAASPS